MVDSRQCLFLILDATTLSLPELPADMAARLLGPRQDEPVHERHERPETHGQFYARRLELEAEGHCLGRLEREAFPIDAALGLWVSDAGWAAPTATTRPLEPVDWSNVTPHPRLAELEERCRCGAPRGEHLVGGEERAETWPCNGWQPSTVESNARGGK